jgi:hypothetical protein
MHARDAFTEMMRNMKRNFDEAKTGIKDVRQDIEHVLLGQPRVEGFMSMSDDDRGGPEEKLPGTVDSKEDFDAMQRPAVDVGDEPETPAGPAASPSSSSWWRWWSRWRFRRLHKSGSGKATSYGTIFSNKHKKGPRDVSGVCVRAARR